LLVFKLTTVLNSIAFGDFNLFGYVLLNIGHDTSNVTIENISLNYPVSLIVFAIDLYRSCHSFNLCNLAKGNQTPALGSQQHVANGLRVTAIFFLISQMNTDRLVLKYI
jgi:hypothetical protein